MSNETKPKRRFRRLIQQRAGLIVPALSDYDDYSDVREACERKLAEWRRAGVLILSPESRGNDWLFH